LWLAEEAEKVGKDGGGFEACIPNSGKAGGRWLDIPNGYSNDSVNHCISCFKEIGITGAEAFLKELKTIAERRRRRRLLWRNL
jgi:hypothetical protein